MADSKNQLIDGVASTLGVVLHLVLLLVFLSAGLVVPAWFVGVLLCVWIVMALLAFQRRANELYLVVAPLVAFGLLIVAVTIGEQAFDWTA